MKSRNLFWGGILVTIGTLFILRNTGVFYFNWVSLLRLWPIFLVFLGITLLPIRDGIKAVLSLLTIAVLILFLYSSRDQWTYDDDYNWELEDRWDRYADEEDYESDIDNQYFYEPYSSEIEEATLNIQAIAGDFSLRSSTEHLFEFTQDGNIGPYILTSTSRNNHKTLGLELRDGKKRIRNLINDVTLKLNTNPIWNFDIETGAAEIDLDLRLFKTQEISIAGGASDIDLRLGSKHKITNVFVQSGASSITIAVPKGSACEIITQTILSSRDFDEFEKIERGYYQTSNYDDAENKIQINVEAAVTSLKVRRY